MAFRVRCEKCGVVDFDFGSDNDPGWLGNPTIASYYAGFHDGRRHGHRDKVFSFAERIPDDAGQREEGVDSR